MLYILIIVVIFLIDDKIKNYIEENKEMHKKEVILKNHIVINVIIIKVLCLALWKKTVLWLNIYLPHYLVLYF